MTDAEKRLWYLLRDRRFSDHKFRRQYPVESYIADFACVEALLIVEVDGGQHTENAEEDAKRTAFLEQNGWRVLRFWNHDVLRHTETVLETIAANLGNTLTRPALRPVDLSHEGEVTEAQKLIGISLKESAI
jgi:adenine-specific DNA-methyltransferase